MPTFPRRASLPLALSVALTLALGACSDEPAATADTTEQVAPSIATTPATTPAAPAAPPAPRSLPPATTAFERALRELTNGANVRFESEATLSGGSAQYASGAGSVLNASFVLRTLPNPNAQYDGTWLLQAGRYMKEAGASFDFSSLPPPAAAYMFAALTAIPQSESTLSGAPTTETVGSVQCSARQVALPATYKALEVCVDETQAKLIRLKAELQSGERLTVTFSGHGEPVQLPQTQIKDWSQEYPRR